MNHFTNMDEDFEFEDGLIVGDVRLLHKSSGNWRHLYNIYKDRDISNSEKIKLINKAKEDILRQIVAEQSRRSHIMPEEENLNMKIKPSKIGEEPTEPPKVNSLSLEEEERLHWLIEEAGEVIQAATKTLRYGYASVHPDDPEGPNKRQNLEKEIADFELAVRKMEQEHDVNSDNILNLMLIKLRRFMKGLHFFHYNNFTDANENHSHQNGCKNS